MDQFDLPQVWCLPPDSINRTVAFGNTRKEESVLADRDDGVDHLHEDDRYAKTAVEKFR
jgi:hypothetical protein